MDENVVCVKSSKPGGRKKVIYKTKEFVFNKSLKDGVKYVCKYQANKLVACKAFIKLDFGLKRVTDQKNNSHGCNHQKSDCDRTKMNVVLKDMAKDYFSSNARLFADQLQQCPTDSKAQIVAKEKSTLRVMRKARRISIPPEPKTLAELEPLSGVWATTGDRNNPMPFMLYDSGIQNDEAGRIIIFSTIKLLRVYARADTLAADGNFQLSPRLFQQIYLVQAKIDSVRGYMWVSVAYIFLERKTSETYRQLFGKLAELCLYYRLPNPNPKILLVDFEIGVIQGISSVHPGIQIQACYFHLTQSTFRNVQMKGMSDRYLDSAEGERDEDFYKFCCLLDSLAFLPPHEVRGAFRHLENESFGDVDKEVIAYYFGSTYVTGRRTSKIVAGRTIIRISPPLFPVQYWNVWEATLNNTERTNNRTEGTNCRLFHMSGKQRRGVYQTVALFRVEAIRDEARLDSFLDGSLQPDCSRTTYEALQRRLRTICQNYQSGHYNQREFLLAISKNLPRERRQ